MMVAWDCPPGNDVANREDASSEMEEYGRQMAPGEKLGASPEIFNPVALASLDVPWSQGGMK